LPISDKFLLLQRKMALPGPQLALRQFQDRIFLTPGKPASPEHKACSLFDLLMGLESAMVTP
jgi:hypothetical protein